MKLERTLYLIIASLILISIVFDFFGFKWGFVISKPLTTIAIIGIPLLLIKSKKNAYQRLTIIALIWCCIGDVLLLDKAYFLFGLIAFLIGHLILIWSFIQKNGFLTYKVPALILLIYGASMYGFLLPYLGEMRIPVSVYILVIMAMAWQGISAYLKASTKEHKCILIGVMLFMLSDSILAIDLFYKSFYTSGIWVLASYWTALFFIAKASTSDLAYELSEQS